MLLSTAAAGTLEIRFFVLSDTPGKRLPGVETTGVASGVGIGDGPACASLRGDCGESFEKTVFGLLVSPKGRSESVELLLTTGMVVINGVGQFFLSASGVETGGPVI